MQVLHVSPKGNDQWSGRRAKPLRDGSDGPMASITGARDALRRLKSSGQLEWPAEVLIQAGRYPITSPLVFGFEDSMPVTYRAARGAKVIIDGGQRISDWETTTINGQKAWVAELPDVKAGRWNFRSLFVNGRRRLRPQLPKPTKDPIHRPWFHVKDVPGVGFRGPWNTGANVFECDPGNVRAFMHLSNVEVVVAHFWVDARLPIVSFDPTTNVVTTSFQSRFRLSDDFSQRGARYYLDNVFEALTEPGEWYLERLTGRLYYLPLPGETQANTYVAAPRVETLLEIRGEPESHRYAEYLRFEGLTFEHTDWSPVDARAAARKSGASSGLKLTSPQAAAHLAGMLTFTGARHCAIENCAVRCGGFYGIEIAAGSSSISIIGNTLTELGGGGVKINGGDAHDDSRRRTGLCTISDNHIHDVGQVFHSSVGVLSMHSHGNRIVHNHIHNLFYSCISVGWVWGYGPSVSCDNLIAFNHCHDYGKKWLADMGGIYLLGVAPGTVVRNNLIHDAVSSTYGALGIYLDEGSSHVLVENNVCFRFTSQAFAQHYGRENIIRNNLLALGAKSVVALSRSENHNSFTMQNNILLADGAPIFSNGNWCDLESIPIRSDLNLLWDVTGKVEVGRNIKHSTRDRTQDQSQDFRKWQKLGHDAHSLVANPKCTGPKYQLAPNSPALKLGFRTIDLDNVGPRAKGKRSIVA